MKVSGNQDYCCTCVRDVRPLRFFYKLVAAGTWTPNKPSILTCMVNEMAGVKCMPVQALG